jgi:uncharacterized protein YndB with AHSA1/START domain/rhodanese-related sulfurtransferase
MTLDGEWTGRPVGRGALEHVTRAIRAPAEKIWAALTDPDVVRMWLGEVSPPFQLGRLSQLATGDGDVHALEIFHMEPPHHLEYGRRRFGIDVKETIDWTVVPNPDGCLVTVSWSASEHKDDHRSPEHEEWLFHTDRLEKVIAGVPLPAAPPDREFLLSTDLPGGVATVQDHLTRYLGRMLDTPPNALAEGYRTTISLTDGTEPSDRVEPSDVELTCRADPSTFSVCMYLDHATWSSPTSARLALRQRAQGTRLTVRHRGWEGVAFDDRTRIRHRRRFAQFWHMFFLRFTFDYVRSWQIPTLSAADLKARMDLSEVFVFDANRTTLWTRGHIPRAVFVGQEDIPVDRLPSDKTAELVFYCRDTMCLTAYLSAAQARTLGYPNTLVMEGGRQGWTESGFPLVAEDGASAAEPEPTDAIGA